MAQNELKTSSFSNKHKNEKENEKNSFLQTLSIELQDKHIISPSNLLKVPKISEKKEKKNNSSSISRVGQDHSKEKRQKNLNQRYSDGKKNKKSSSAFGKKDNSFQFFKSVRNSKRSHSSVFEPKICSKL